MAFKKSRGVCELFDKFTFHAIKRGHKKMSAWMIINNDGKPV